jgi:hypothetical protein
MYSAGTTPVYIGRTHLPRGRQKWHRVSSPWWLPCFTFSIVGTYSQDGEGKRAERALIKELRPMFNLQSNPDYLHCRPTRHEGPQLAANTGDLWRELVELLGGAE